MTDINAAASRRPPPRFDDLRHVQEFGRLLRDVREELRLRVVGQDRVVEELLVSILAEGHCLLIGVPGLAKTLLVSTFAELLGLDSKRIQFTPDLMPNDITGAAIIADASPDEVTSDESTDATRALRFLKGPVFTNLLLADEINRTPPKTQAALMEAMEERQITAHGTRYPLERPFFVLATQNPIEQEGTYPLPVTQLDRFLFNVLVDYPRDEEEFRIMELTTSAYEGNVRCLLDRDRLLDILELTRQLDIPDELVDYATRLVRATRPQRGEPGETDGRRAAFGPLTEARHSAVPSGTARSDGDRFPFIKEWVSWGGGPRAIQAILMGARGRAMLYGRSRVQVDDLHRVVFPALRHRILLNYHGEAEGISTDDIIRRVLLAMPDGLYLEPRVTRRKGPLSLLRRLFGLQDE